MAQKTVKRTVSKSALKDALAETLKDKPRLLNTNPWRIFGRTCVMTPLRLSVCRAVAVATLTIALPAFAAQVAYNTAEEAYNVGVRFINDGNLAAAREPLEAALKLAKTDDFRLRVQRTLLVPYRELQEIEPMQGAAEYIISNSKQQAERSLTRSNLLTFVQRRGKLDVAIAGYEARLKMTPNDRTVLYVLTEAYANFKRDPVRGAALGEKLAAVEKKLGSAQDTRSMAQLADQYVKSAKAREGAELYEKVAALDAKTEAWYYREAATAWLKAGDKKKALAAAGKSAAATPEKRALLDYFWHKGLADVYLDAGAPREAIPHYEQAIAATKIEGYKNDCQARLAKARAAAGM